ncbi:hypothetical protein GCM10022221_49390 [Actinocorallia aurea]
MDTGYTLRDRGRNLAVELWAANGRQCALLLMEGRPVQARAARVLRSAAFELGEAPAGPREARSRQRVKVRFLWGGRAWACDLLDVHGRRRLWRSPIVTRFTPPPGCRARRWHEIRERHPALYAMRHVVNEGIVMTAALLGIGALLSALFRHLLPRIDWSWLPDPPSWDLPDWDPPDLDWLSYALPIVVALYLSVRELRRRRRRLDRERRFESARRRGGRR